MQLVAPNCREWQHDIAKQRARRRFAATLAAGVGCLRLMGKDQGERLPAPREAWAECFIFLVTAQSRRIAEIMGDFAFVKFAGVAHSAEYTVAVRNAVAECNAA